MKEGIEVQRWSSRQAGTQNNEVTIMRACRKGSCFSIVLTVSLIVTLSVGQSIGQSMNYVVPRKKAVDDKHPINDVRTAKSAVDYRPFRRSGVHDGNLIRTAFSNFGNLGSRTLDVRLEWPKGSGINYGFEFIFFVGAEVVDARGDTIHIFTDNYTGGPRDRAPDDSHTYGWEPLPGYYNDGEFIGGISEDANGNGRLDPGEDLNRNGKLDLSLKNTLEFPAMSHLPATWPEYWPPGSYPGDDRGTNDLRPGARAGLWNGEFGAFVRADQESYYVMDDRNNDEFLYFPFIGNAVDSLAWPDGRRGLGLEVEVRNMQWSDILAEDIIISIYQLKNVSDKDLPVNLVGMYIDADVGTEGTASDAGDDASFFDTVDDITYQWDLDGLSAKGKRVGYFGFAFLLSPGIDNDGIDQDEDGMVDESQEDGIDNDGDWRSFDDSNNSGKYEWEDLNQNGLLDTELDETVSGIDYNFDGDTDDIVNEDSWHPTYSLTNGKLDAEDPFDDLGSDGIGPLDPFWPGPDPDGTEGNGRPDEPEPNFEGTDNDEIDQIGLTSFFGTTAGDVLSDDEEAWFVKSFPGVFTQPTGGVDVAYHYASGFFEVNKGRSERYSIASLVGNDFDDIIRNKRTMQEIFDNDFDFKKPPLEPTILYAVAGDRKVTLVWDARAERSRDPIYGNDFAMYKIYRSTDPSFNDIKTITDAFGNALLWESIAQFDKIDGLTGSHPMPVGDTGAHYDMGQDTGLRHSFVDTTVENGRTYYYAVVSVDLGYAPDFFEKGIHPVDGLLPTWPSESSKTILTDLAGNVVNLGRNTAVVVPRRPAAGYDFPQIADGRRLEHVEGPATGSIFADVLVPDDVRDGHVYEITFTDTTLERRTKEFFLEDVTDPDDPVLLLRGDGQFDNSRLDLQIVDGFRLQVFNDSVATVDEARWISGVTNLLVDARVDNSPRAVALPEDFEIRVAETLIDTSFSPIRQFRKPVNFQVWNTTRDEKFEFLFTEGGEPDSALTVGDEILIITNRVGNSFNTAWELKFGIARAEQDTINPPPGAVFRFTTLKPFSSEDVFRFETIGWAFDQTQAKEDLLERVFVVPDPYVAVNTTEPPIFNVRGRGERRIEFVNLPQKCTIRIFTIAGKLVREISHNSTRDNGSESWDLLSKDGLDVAYGTYIYHVEAPGIGSKVGKFSLIK